MRGTRTLHGGPASGATIGAVGHDLPIAWRCHHNYHNHPPTQLNQTCLMQGTGGALYFSGVIPLESALMLFAQLPR